MRSVVIVTIAVLFVSLMLVLKTEVNAQEAGVSKQQLLDVNYSGPVFQDAFWTNAATPPAQGASLDKIEVGPGDGVSVLAVVLVNRGTSEITSITGILDLPSGFKAIAGSNQATAKQNSIVEPGQAFTLLFEVNVPNTTEVAEYDAQMHVQFSRVLEVGQYRNVDISVPFLLTGKVVLDAEAVNREIVPGSANPVTVMISNRGTAPATGTVITVLSSSSSSSSSTVGTATSNGSTSSLTVGQKVFDVGTLPANSTAEIHPIIYASNGAAQTPQLVNLHISYNNAYGIKTGTDIQVGFVVLPRALESDISILSTSNSSAIVTAGKLYAYNFTVSNTSGKPLSNVLITLESSSASDSVKILGDSKWTVKSMDPGYNKVFTTIVYAPTNFIGESTTFAVSLQYLSENQTKTDAASLGAYIDGEIRVTAYEVNVNYVGDTPNIVGNLLNEGNTKALFTSIQLTNAQGLSMLLPPSQYLGDLEENSPLPFSIPIDINNGAVGGTYPVSLKLTYMDNLRQVHTVDINTQVKFEPKPVTLESSGPAIRPVFLMGISVIVATAIIITVIILVRRKKKSNLKRIITERKQSDIESLLDSQRLKTDEHK